MPQVDEKKIQDLQKLDGVFKNAPEYEPRPPARTPDLSKLSDTRVALFQGCPVIPDVSFRFGITQTVSLSMSSDLCKRISCGSGICFCRVFLSAEVIYGGILSAIKLMPLFRLRQTFSART
ncbi:hypothetical protein P7I89_05435 [Pseudomonas aeruginosa]|nr:hypothetical protein P7I89_05435 [Pseudomonas aeruginosa]